MADDNILFLGEFWVDSDGEVFTDSTDPLAGLQNAVKLQQIQELQRKLQKQIDQQEPQNTPIQHSNRPRQARGKGKGY